MSLWRGGLPPLGSWEVLTCRSQEWTRRPPRAPSLCTIGVVVHGSLEIGRDGFEIPLVLVQVGSMAIEEGNCVFWYSLCVGWPQSFKGSVCLLPPETFPPLRNVRHGFRLAGSGCRTWLLELSFMPISCLAGTRAHCSHVIWLHAA